MDFRLNNSDVRAETILFRVVRARHVDRWLVVTTNVEPDSPAILALINDAHAILGHSPDLAGIEVQSVEKLG